MRIAAFDVDLHKIYCVDSNGKIILKATPHISLPESNILEKMDVVLAEIASPVSGARNAVNSNAVNFNLMKWVIFNVAKIAELFEFLINRHVPLLVAPSNVWTKGYPLGIRHEVYNCKHKQKDLRECEAMIGSYKAQPSLWVPYLSYLESL